MCVLVAMLLLALGAVGMMVSMGMRTLHTHRAADSSQEKAWKSYFTLTETASKTATAGNITMTGRGGKVMSPSYVCIQPLVAEL